VIARIAEPARGRPVLARSGLRRAFALRAALVYVAFGAAWIVASDRLVHALADEPVVAWVQSAKGLAFVAASALLLFASIDRFGRARDAAERELRTSEERFRTLVERVPGIVYLNEVDPRDPSQTRCVYVGPQLREILGYEPLEWIADDELWHTVIHPEDRERAIGSSEAADATGEVSFEYRALARDGRTVWIHDEAIRVDGHGERPTYWLGIMVDITPQRVADQALHELTQSLSGVFTASPLAIMVLEPDGRVRQWNPAAERMFGWSAAEVIGRPLPYVPEDKRGEFARLRRQVLEGGSFAGVEVARVRKDGSPIRVSVSTAPSFDADGNVEAIIAVVEDVTERRAAADALARRARQQEVVAALGATALAGGPLAGFLEEVMGVVAETIDVELVALLEPDGEDGGFVLTAGLGWPDGLVGTQVVTPGSPSLAGHALLVDEPVIVMDASSEWRFGMSPSFVAHGVVSAISVAVHAGGERPAAALEALSREPRAFTRDEAHFLRAVAALVGFAIERDRAETALRDAEARYRQLVEAGPGVVYVHDGLQVPPALSYVSPQVVDLLGYPLERFREDPRFWIECVHPDDRARVLSADARAIAEGEPLALEYRLIAADGREVWVQDRARTVRDAEGAPLSRQGLLVDVTERRRAEEERRRAIESQMRLATRIEVLHQIERDVLAATSVREMADRALAHLRALVPYDRASVGYLDRDTGRYGFLAERVHGPGSPFSEVEVTDEEVAALLGQEVLSIADLREVRMQTPLAERALSLGMRSVLSVALIAEGEQLGNLILAAGEPHAFDDETRDIAREVASQLAVGMRQSWLREALRERADQLERLAEERQQLLRKIVRAQEEERERVALELHDGLGQMLTSISLFASDLENDVAEEARPRAAKVNELIRMAIEDSRQLVWSLRPPELERLGLVPAIRRLADDVSLHGDVEVDLHEEIGDLRLAPEAEAVVYRVVQEAVHNAQKHARASSISVHLRRSNGSLTALVEDDGRGFDPAAVSRGHGLGLLGMRERAELIDGDLVVESGSGSGTRVRLEVPLAAARSSDG
jgi:PAS domain S-box-containing protein